MKNPAQKPEIEFPCRWGYKVIGFDSEAVAEAIRECLGLRLGADLGSRGLVLEPSRASAGGKYVSWSVNLRVDSLPERDEIFSAFSSHEAVRMVI